MDNPDPFYAGVEEMGENEEKERKKKKGKVFS